MIFLHRVLSCYFFRGDRNWTLGFSLHSQALEAGRSRRTEHAPWELFVKNAAHFLVIGTLSELALIFMHLVLRFRVSPLLL